MSTGSASSALQRLLADMETKLDALRDEYSAVAAKGESGDDAAAKRAGELIALMASFRKGAEVLRASLASTLEEDRIAQAAAEEAQRALDLAEVRALTKALAASYAKVDRALNAAAKAANNADAIVAQLTAKERIHKVNRAAFGISHIYADAVAAAGSPALARAVNAESIGPKTLTQHFAELTTSYSTLAPTSNQ